jgi:hypothetical protein
VLELKPNGVPKNGFAPEATKELEPPLFELGTGTNKKKSFYQRLI